MATASDETVGSTVPNSETMGESKEEKVKDEEGRVWSLQSRTFTLLDLMMAEIKKGKGTDCSSLKKESWPTLLAEMQKEHPNIKWTLIQVKNRWNVVMFFLFTALEQ